VNASEGAVGAGHAAFAEASPFGIESKKLAMWLFIASDTVTFTCLLFGYSFLRVGSPDWTKPFEFVPSVLNGMVMTVILLTSSLTMLVGVMAAKAGNQKSCLRWMGYTMLLGTIFAILHLREWFSMFHEGWSLSHNPLGGSVEVGTGFFCITGLHLTHVISGVIALAVVAAGYKRGRLTPAHVETTSLYWHFVDIVWMFVFPIMYLMNAK
jgi:heme/copper-type cytochrome/quinol oxidase subunit 3